MRNRSDNQITATLDDAVSIAEITHYLVNSIIRAFKCQSAALQWNNLFWILLKLFFLSGDLVNSWDYFSFEAQTLLIRPEHKEGLIIISLGTAL
jgi:hypothetical protein